MRRLPYILILMVIYLAFCGKSCVDDSGRAVWQEKMAKVAKDSLRHEFEAGFLTEEARFAAEVTAIQKLKDLSDYTNIYSDMSMDTLFREKAGEMIKGMFVSEDNKLSFGPMKNKKMKSITLGEFLESGFGHSVSQAKLVFDSIRVLEPLQKSGEELYSGILAAYQTVILINPTDSIISPDIPVTIRFISSKKTKIFGQDTLQNWEVAIREILRED